MQEKTLNAKDYSAAGLSAIFSNLAKASDKQNRAEEASLFRKLADFYLTQTATDQAGEASLEQLIAAIKEDVGTGFLSAIFAVLFI